MRAGGNPRDWKVAGGAGYSWVIVHHEADFSCATPWWYRLNDTLWMEAQFGLVRKRVANTHKLEWRAR